MKIRTFLVLLFAFFALSLWLGRISTGLGRWPERVDISFAISLTALAAGSLMAVVSLFALLQRGAASVGTRRWGGPKGPNKE